MLLHDRKRDDKKLLNLLKRHCDTEEELLSLFGKENIEIEELKDKISLLQSVREETLCLFSQKEAKEEDKDNERKQLNISGSIVKEKEFDSETIETYNAAKEELANVYKSISDNKTPVLNLNLLKIFLQNISPYFSSLPIFEQNSKIDGIVVILSENDESSQLILKNGRKVIITSRNADFTDFNYNELIEILRFFDTIVSDNSLDYLRTEITKQINAISNVSLIKF